jgi:hypothetical protein
MQGGVGSQLVGGIIAIGLGVVAIAAIYQLSVHNAPVVKAGNSVADNTLTNLFKGGN